MRPGDVDWEQIFGSEGARWFHCGGIFAALSETTAELALEAMRGGARAWHDRLLRPQLSRLAVEGRGGPHVAAEVNQRLVDLVDVLLGNEEDFSVGLGYELGGPTPSCSRSTPTPTEGLLREVLERNPELSIVASTLREARTATINDWSAVCRTRSGASPARGWTRLEILDRVGGGDSFASGFFYGLLTGDRHRSSTRLRGGARRAGDDHPGRHLDGHASRTSNGSWLGGRPGCCAEASPVTCDSNHFIRPGMRPLRRYQVADPWGPGVGR